MSNNKKFEKLLLVYVYEIRILVTFVLDIFYQLDNIIELNYQVIIVNGKTD